MAMRRIVVATVVGGLCLVDGALAQEPRYDVAAEQCRPYRKGVLDRQWQVSAPRDPRPVGQPVTVGLREKYADTGHRLLVRARIVGAAAPLESKPVLMVEDSFANVEFPRDFPPTRPLAPGAYTVLWQLAETGGFLACDGFIIR
jgi:hypothetical protein